MAKTEKKEKNNKRFFKDFKSELKKVVWPTPKQVANNTTAVVTIVLITALIVFVLDFTFEILNNYGINQIRIKLDSNNSAVENTLEENITENENVVEEAIEENAVVENNVAE